MPKLPCACGYVHDLSPIPDGGWITVRDRDYERLLAAEAEREGLRARGAAAGEYGPADRVVHETHGLLYECPRCGRLLWKPPGAAEYRAFEPAPPAG